MNTRTTMKTTGSGRRRLAILVGAILLANALPHEAAAQSANANLRGKAPPKAEVTVKNPATGFTRRIQAGDDGSYMLVGLPPGTYQVDAGPGTERTVTLIVSSTATLNFEGGEQVTDRSARSQVSGARLAEVRTSEVGAQHFVAPDRERAADHAQLPRVRRHRAGHEVRGRCQGQYADPQRALNTGATNVYIDGVGQKNYVRPSGITGQAGADPCGTCGANQVTVGDPGNPFPQLAIGEYKVITSNYKAEYDQVSGAAITAVTRSGTNEFEASAFMTYTDADLREKTPAEKAAGTGQARRRQQGVRPFAGRADHQGPHAFLPHLRGQGVHDAQHHPCTGSSSTSDGNVLDYTDRPDPGAAGELRPGRQSVRRRPVLRQDRLADLRRRSPRAVGQVPPANPAGRRGRRVRRVRGIHLRQRRRAHCAALGTRGRHASSTRRP